MPYPLKAFQRDRWKQEGGGLLQEASARPVDVMPFVFDEVKNRLSHHILSYDRGDSTSINMLAVYIGSSWVLRFYFTMRGERAGKIEAVAYQPRGVIMRGTFQIGREPVAWDFRIADPDVFDKIVAFVDNFEREHR